MDREKRAESRLRAREKGCAFFAARSLFSLDHTDREPGTVHNNRAVNIWQ